MRTCDHCSREFSGSGKSWLCYECRCGVPHRGPSLPGGGCWPALEEFVEDRYDGNSGPDDVCCEPELRDCRPPRRRRNPN